VPQLFAHISVSLDGFVEDVAGEDGFFPVDQSFHEHIDAILASIEGMVFGRKAFDRLATFWPDAGDYGDVNLSRQAGFMNSLPKYVLSKRPLSANWSNSTSVSLDDLARLKGRARGPIAVFAGATAIQQVLAAGLLDEIQLLRQPVILGGGLPLFSKGTDPVRLELLSTKSLGTGAVLECYKPLPDMTEGEDS
jgi:dihydrofolate reductase